MAGDLDFSPDEFQKLSVAERIARCRQLSARADELAQQAHNPHRVHYLQIARQWTMLADEMERDFKSRS